MKAIFSEFNDPRYYKDHPTTRAVVPNLSLAQLEPKICARCHVNEVPRATPTNHIPPGRKYCDPCRPLVAKEQRRKPR